MAWQPMFMIWHFMTNALTRVEKETEININRMHGAPLKSISESNTTTKQSKRVVFEKLVSFQSIPESKFPVETTKKHPLQYLSWGAQKKENHISFLFICRSNHGAVKNIPGIFEAQFLNFAYFSQLIVQQKPCSNKE